MPRLICVLALSPLLWLLVTPVHSADDVKLARTSAYFPLEIGTTWHYRAGEGRFKVTVTKHEKKGDVVAARLETFGDKDKLLSTEHVAVTKDEDAIVRVASQDKVLTTPIVFLKLPPKKHLNVPWQVASKLDGKEVKGSFEIRSLDKTVKVPAGSYRTVVVEGENLEVLGNKLSLTYQFAEGVGMVKQTMELAGQKIVVELEKFEKGK